ncbi:hypothetical protein OG394_15830 [Kribbella sp. NBC_01245]|nr:hypothetical protein [Kribbella sp. NBC_01245]
MIAGQFDALLRRLEPRIGNGDRQHGLGHLFVEELVIDFDRTSGGTSY